MSYARSCRSNGSNDGSLADLASELGPNSKTLTVLVCANWYDQRQSKPEVKPDGQACRLCFRQDDDWDPVILAVKNAKCYMFWAKTPDANGISIG